MQCSRSYSLLLACILLGLCSNAWAASLPLGQTQTGTIGSAAQTVSYTFSANANDVVSLTMTATSGTLSPMIQLQNSGGTVLTTAYPSVPGGACSGGSRTELNTFVLTQAGTYTAVVSDCAGTNTGNYAVYAQLTNNPSGSTSLPSGPTETGTIASAAQSDSYVFSGNGNAFLTLTMSATSGTLSPKIRLYNSAGTPLTAAYPSYPNGGCSGASSTAINMFQLPSTGTYTVLVGDCSDANTGGYQISAQLANPSSNPILPFGQTQAGTIASAAQSTTYTFLANTNDVVNFSMTATSGSLSPKIRLYGPTGTLLSTATPKDTGGHCTGASAVELNTFTLTQSGVYTALASDCQDTNTGSYTIYTQLSNNPSGAANLPLGQTATSLVNWATQNDTYTFSANANDTVDLTATATSGSLSPKIRLYNPDGTSLSTATPKDTGGHCTGASTVELNTVKLPATGRYTVLLADCGDTGTGNYALYAQLTDDPTAPVGVLWGQVQPGQIPFAAQSNSYSFGGIANNTINFTATTTSGSFSPKIRLYNPDGTLLNSVYPHDSGGHCTGTGTIQMNSVTLAQNGSYTVLVGDCSDTNIGTYNLSSLCFGTCSAPGPGLISMSPTSATAGGSGFTLTVNGANFVTNSTVYWEGKGRATNYVSSTQLTAAILASDIATGGSFPVTVVNPSVGAGSNAINFTVNSVPTPIFVFGTGYVAGGPGLTNVGSVDGNFTLISCPAGAACVSNGKGGYKAFVTMTGQYPFPPWLADTSTAQWIGPANGGNEATVDASGVYVYRQTFDLTGFDLATVAVSGAFAIDDVLGSIQLNGVAVGPTNSSFTTPTPFNLTSGFVAGKNTLDFVVTNGPVGGVYNPTGLFVQVSGNGVLFPYTIAGQVTLSGSGLSGVTVALGGSASTTTITDSSGNYSFPGLTSGGSYTVTPSKSGYTFAPPSSTFNSLTANQTASFVATAITYSITGQVTLSNSGLSGVTITLSGAGSGTTTTDSSGNYSFTGLTPGGSYTVTPSKSGYTFAPTNAQFNSLSANQTALFTATAITYGISGQVTLSSSGLGGVTVTLSGTGSGTTTTDSSGNYNFAGLTPGGSYTVTPSKSGYTFAPTNAPFNSLGAPQTANFTATAITYSISGQVTLSSGGLGLGGVTMTLSGTGTGTTTTDSSGNYSFTGLTPGGGYTVTPSKSGYTFAPTHRQFDTLGADQTATFAATAITYSISGQVTLSSSGLGGVTMTLSGTGSGTTTSDSSGNYSFTGLTSGGSYTVTPSKSGYTFNPTSATINSLSANQTATFVANTIAAPVLTVVKSHSGSFTQGGQGSYSIVVSNAAGAGATSGTVTVNDTLPSGLSIASIGAGASWTCTTSPVRCTTTTVLLGGSSYPAITVNVNVAGNATSPQVNTASVSGGGFTGTATSNDSTTITSAAPVLSIAKSHVGNFTQNQQGATYTIIVSNAAGAGPTSGPVTVNDTLPSGLGIATISGGSTWTCTTQPVQCSTATGLPGGSTYTPITVTVNVSGNATSPLVNTASASGGGFSGTATVNDSTTVLTQTASVVTVPSTTGATAGGTFSFPVTLSLAGGVSIDAFTVAIQITPGTGAPAFTTPLTFTPDSSITDVPFVGTANTNNTIGVAWGSFTATGNLSGTRVLGVVSGTVPATATVGQSYTVAITGVGATNGGGINPVPVTPGTSGSLTVGSTYLVGDVYPFTGDMAPNFGDTSVSDPTKRITVQDVVQVLFAVDNVPGYAPRACSDRFDAMDSYPVDTGTARGGDGVLDIRDLIREMARASLIDTSRPTRASHGGCSSNQNAAMTAEALRRPPDGSEGALEFGSVESLNGAQSRMAVYLVSRRGFTQVALTFALGDGQSAFTFTPGAAAPTLSQSTQSGATAMAWLQGVNVRAGERLLLGYVDGPPSTLAGLQVYGLSAARLQDNQAVQLDSPNRLDGSR